MNLPESNPDYRHATRRMLQSLDAYWLHYDGLPAKRYPRGRYETQDWWHRFERYRCEVEAAIRSSGAEHLGREGLVTVYDDQGRYLGCMGVFLWQALLDAGSARKDSPCRPRPDYDPHSDHPERFTEGPI